MAVAPGSAAAAAQVESHPGGLAHQTPHVAPQPQAQQLEAAPDELCLHCMPPPGLQGGEKGRDHPVQNTQDRTNEVSMGSALGCGVLCSDGK